MSRIVLMYHGLYEDEASLESTITVEDRPYAVSRAAFRRHLAMIKAVREQHPEREILLTFDDGHISNRTMAMPDLQHAGLSGLFFITTGFMRERDHFCRADDVKALHEGGMLIGSHGDSHRFLDDPDEAMLRREFQRSRTELEAAIGAPVHSLSFPGGRYTVKSVQLAHQAGLTELHGSEPGINTANATGESRPLKRVAIRNGTSDDEFRRMISADRSYFAKVVAIQSAKQLVRKILGNRLYHGLYKSVADLR